MADRKEVDANTWPEFMAAIREQLAKAEGLCGAAVLVLRVVAQCICVFEPEEAKQRLATMPAPVFPGVRSPTPPKPK